MRERPILFSAEMVKAILAGKKSQTRRVVKQQWPDRHPMITGPRIDCVDGVAGMYALGGALMPEYGTAVCPYGQPGDRLWLRETWRPFEDEEGLGTCVQYKADGGLMKPTRWTHDQGAWCQAHAEYPDWRPSIHMPRWASRIQLLVKSVRVERLQNISHDDAAAEGVEWFRSSSAECPGVPEHPIPAYRQPWEQIHGLGSWDMNPWVWVVEFGRSES